MVHRIPPAFDGLTAGISNSNQRGETAADLSGGVQAAVLLSSSCCSLQRRGISAPGSGAETFLACFVNHSRK
jgi:hypothetical protein